MNATITIKFVNAPKAGKTFGSVKTSSDEMYGYNPAKVSLRQGATYDVDYSTREYEGKTYKTVEKATEKAGGASNSAGHSDRQIFITGIVGRSMGSGKFTATDIKMLTLAAAEAWDALQAKPKEAPADDPNAPPF